MFGNTQALDCQTLQEQWDLSADDYWTTRRYLIEHKFGLDLDQGDDKFLIVQQLSKWEKRLYGSQAQIKTKSTIWCSPFPR